MSYTTAQTNIVVEIDTKHRHLVWGKDPLSQPNEVGPTLQITGTIEVELSITRDNGNYGGRSDDYSGDPDEVSIEDWNTYELWITNIDDDPDGEGTRFHSDNPILNPQFILDLIPNTEDMEVSYDDCD